MNKRDDEGAAANSGVLFFFCGRFFMSIGSVIRTEGVSSRSMEAYMSARRHPIIMQSSGEKRRAR